MGRGSHRPHARHAAAGRARRAQRKRLLTWAVPAGVVALAAVVAVVLVATGGSKETPAPGSPAELALGEEVFGRRCETCHGPGAAGGIAGPPLIHEIYSPTHHPDSTIRAAVAQGVRPHHWEFAGMPAIPDPSAADVDAVIAYVRHVQREEWGGDTPP